MNYKKYTSFVDKMLKTHNLKIIVGKSVKNKPIFAYHFGHFNKKQLLMSASIHAREYISSAVAAKITAHSKTDFGVWYIPFCNPDGVEIVLNNIKQYSKNPQFFKSNANFVDLNVNFDANWGYGDKNIKYPHFENYIGPRPTSEIETQSLCQFTKRLQPFFVVNFHTKGEVIYYGDNLLGKNKGVDKTFAEKLQNITGFPAIKTTGSYGGFSDWCEMKLNIPAITIELGSDLLPHPIELSHFNNIYKKIKNILKIFEN